MIILPRRCSTVQRGPMVSGKRVCSLQNQAPTSILVRCGPSTPAGMGPGKNSPASPDSVSRRRAQPRSKNWRSAGLHKRWYRGPRAGSTTCRKTPDATNHRPLAIKEIKPFLLALDADEGRLVSKLAIQLLVLTLTSSGSTLGSCCLLSVSKRSADSRNSAALIRPLNVSTYRHFGTASPCACAWRQTPGHRCQRVRDLPVRAHELKTRVSHLQGTRLCEC
jgi:hypothetical protein